MEISWLGIDEYLSFKYFPIQSLMKKISKK